MLYRRVGVVTIALVSTIVMIGFSTLSENQNIDEYSNIKAEIKNDLDGLTNKVDGLQSDVNTEIARVRAIAMEKQSNVNRLTTLSRGGFVTWKNYDLRVVSNLDTNQLEKLIKGTGLQGLGVYYERAEKEYKVNALALIAISALESGWGTSHLAKTKNNLVGYGAYDGQEHKAISFKTKGDCIMTVARDLSKDYLTEGGKYFNGYTLTAVNVKYCSRKDWAGKVANIITDLCMKLE